MTKNQVGWGIVITKDQLFMDNRWEFSFALAAIIMIASDPALADVSSRDRKACLRAVVKETRNKVATVLGTEESEANETVYVGVGKQKARWKCLVKHGIVAEVTSQVDEGAL